MSFSSEGVLIFCPHYWNEYYYFYNKKQKLFKKKLLLLFWEIHS